MISKKLAFKDSQGNTIVGILSKPDEGYDVPVVVTCHGFFSSKDGMGYTKLESNLIKHDIAILRLDLFGHGESEGDIADVTLSKAVDGVLEAYKLLEEMGFQEFGLYGCSFGGCVALNVAAEINEKLSCLVCKCPVSDYKQKIHDWRSDERIEEYKEKGYYMHPQHDGSDIRINIGFYEDMPNNNAHKKADQITIPTLIVHGDEDQDVSVDQSIKTAALLPDCRLEVIQGAGHKFATPANAYERLDKFFEDFFVENIG